MKPIARRRLHSGRTGPKRWAGEEEAVVHCHVHPEAESRVVCQKVNIRGYCQSCLDQGVPCFDPSIYCKFRGQCVIWEMARENGLHRPAQDAA